MIHVSWLDIPVEIDFTSGLSDWIDKVTAYYGKKTGEVFFLFCSDAYLYEMNLAHLLHDTLTDIITFDTSENPGFISGELYISFERVTDNARQLGYDFMDELHRVMIHGILHLIGFKDKSQQDVQDMRSQEEFCLSLRPGTL